ncbi:MAG: sulfite exporter TauE/SafE family protein [Deltaproteobacteria bacterium]|nr:sulfite exporter TauE/SafE family protein [Deltaproteobacteria bacterium]
MLAAKPILLAALVVAAVGFAVLLASDSRRSRSRNEPGTPSGEGLLLGFVTNFFDTLGIGSFAPTTSYLKLRGGVADERIPGTLNVGHTLPSIAQALIFIVVVEVEPVTLVAMIAAAVLGAWLGAATVSRWPRRRIQAGMGCALAVAVAVMLATNLDLLPLGGDGLGLGGGWLLVAVAANFVLGALMTLGIGLYAPCMILVSLLGMSPRAAFPIMMGSCAFLMPVAGARFVRAGAYDVRTAVGLALGGIPGVLLAGLVVESLPLAAVRWLVVVVAAYAAIVMLRSARAGE